MENAGTYPPPLDLDSGCELVWHTETHLYCTHPIPDLRLDDSDRFKLSGVKRGPQLVWRREKKANKANLAGGRLVLVAPQRTKGILFLRLATNSRLALRHTIDVIAKSFCLLLTLRSSSPQLLPNARPPQTSLRPHSPHYSVCIRALQSYFSCHGAVTGLSGDARTLRSVVYARRQWRSEAAVDETEHV